MGDPREEFEERIDPTEMRTVKAYSRAGRDIKEVIIVRAGEDLAGVAAHLDCEERTRKERGLALANEGAIRFAVEVPEAVPGPWKPFAVPFERFDDGEICRVIYAPPTYYVQPVRRGVARAEDRDEPGRRREASRGPEPDDDLPFGAWPYGEEVIRGDATGPSSEGKERVIDRFRHGRLLVRRSVDHARPEGEGLLWDLFVFPGDRRDHIWSGEGHDLKRIREDILANREEISARLREIAREKGLRRERARDIGQEP